MNLEYISDTGSCRLLLIFAGWSTDASAFRGLVCRGYDIAVVSDYYDLILPPIPKDYAEVVVMAWSLGVHAAEVVLQGCRLPLTLTLAVNGTPEPVSDSRGIPAAIYRATADRLDERNLAAFRRRMGASNLPRGERSIDSLRDELLNFPLHKIDFRWDRAVISADDRIFPPANQREAWGGRAAITEVDGPHMPDFQHIVDRFVINKSRVESSFRAGSKTYPAQSDVQKRIADHLWSLWRKHLHGDDKGGDILEVGVGDGYFTSLYERTLRPRTLQLWDIAVAADSEGICRADGETEISRLAPASLTAVAAASTIQWFNSVPAFFGRCAKALKPGGLAVFSTFGPETFASLARCGVTPLPYLDIEQLRRAIPPGCTLLELHSGLITKVFPSVAELLRHIRETGVNARPASVGAVRSLLGSYPARPDGAVELVYEPIYLIFRKDE